MIGTEEVQSVEAEAKSETRTMVGGPQLFPWPHDCFSSVEIQKLGFIKCKIVDVFGKKGDSIRNGSWR